MIDSHETVPHSPSLLAECDAAVACVRAGGRVFIHGANAYPQLLVDALVRRADADSSFRDVEIVHLHTNGVAPYVAPRFAGQFTHRALFVGPNVRRAMQCSMVSYTPIFLSDVPALLRSGNFPIDVALLHLSPPDEHGFCSLGVSVDVALAAAETARTCVASINRQMPRTLGDSFLHIDKVAHAVHVDEPLPELIPRPVDRVHHAIGNYLAELIPDGATLQLGIGGVADAMLASLRDHRDLGIHSEVVSDGILDLVELGVITGARKTVNRGKIVAAFLNGSARLNRFAHNNPMVEMRPVDYTNDTRVILRQDNMMAVNSAIAMDLTGQVNAESMGHRIFSGVGGQVDFLRGAALSIGGKPIVAFPSTALGGSVSRIVAELEPGAAVTTTRAHVHYVVTEYGVANLHGLDLAERAAALIGLAHPAFRDELTSSARAMGLL